MHTKQMQETDQDVIIAKVKEAWGLLWHYQGTDQRIHKARKLFSEILDKNDKAEGITLAKGL
jgi:hypothetical protein